MFFNRLSILIWTGLVSALIFPYAGFELSRFGLPILVAMSFVTFFQVNFRPLKFEKKQFRNVLMGLLICYTLFPALQMLLAAFLLDSKSLQLGVLLASLAPIAIIAPQFLSDDQNQQTQSTLYVLLSTLIYPVLIFSYIRMYGLHSLSLPFWPLVRDTLLITLLPLAVSFCFELFFAELKNSLSLRLKKITPLFNFSSIGILVFIYFGSAFAKTNIEQMSATALVAVGALALFQDFGTFYAAKLLGLSRCDAVSFSIKNVALSGGILLIFHPQGILTCSMVFVAHALFFSIMKKPIANY